MMYEIAKRFLQFVVPQKLIKDNEQNLRKLMSWRYRGSDFMCNVCDFELSNFVTLSNHDLLCPNCGSLSRTRRLWSVLEGRIKQKRVLHFSPTRSLQQKLKSSDCSEYITTDYAGEFNTDIHLNIEAITEPENSYDLIICYHVLEHIKNDTVAMKELYRILKPGGICVIQTPFKEGEIYEDESIKTDEARLIHFGQEDHLRIYSVTGLSERLRNSGFELTVEKHSEEEGNLSGFKTKETVILASKP